MKFTKMHGCGNDYIYFYGFGENLPEEKRKDFVRRISDRHYGIGGDGAIFILPCMDADFEMAMYNADGSRGEMCGNGIRCLAKYVYEKGLTSKTELWIRSCNKRVKVWYEPEKGKVHRVFVQMGEPKVLPPCFVSLPEREEPPGKMELPGKVELTCISMGNPHAVLLAGETEWNGLSRIGPYLECHPYFPDRINVELVQVISRDKIHMRVWERGTGETLACGTGACAAAVSCILKGLTNEEVTVKLLGGELFVRWDRKHNQVFLEGPAETVFEGEIKAE